MLIVLRRWSLRTKAFLELDADGDEDCDYVEKPVERFVGAQAITEHLEVTIESYTYANPPE